MPTLVEQLQTIHGIGPAGAADLAQRMVADGHRGRLTIQQVRALLRRHYVAELPAGTQADLQYGFARAIPRAALDVVAAAVAATGTRALICGSYRRGLPTSNDIDLVVRREDWEALRAGINAANGPRIADLFSEGPARLETVVTLIHARVPYAIKMDVFLTTAAAWAATILYATGSKETNLRMRQRAKARGMLLNHLGLFQVLPPRPGDKTIRHQARPIPAREETDIFAALELEYKPPEQR